MGKSLNPIDQHRRAQRKKELLKNKTKRISARDAKIAADPSSYESVKFELQSLERTKAFQEGHLDAKDTKRLERLRKELKIVTAAAEKRAKEKEKERQRLEAAERLRLRTREGVEEWNEDKFGLMARCSIHYDAVMNPFGAPPPGQRQIYWAIGGGKTSNPKLAVIPKELRKDGDPKDGIVHPAIRQNQQKNDGKENAKSISEDAKKSENLMNSVLDKSNISCTVPPPITNVIPPPPSATPSFSTQLPQPLLPSSQHKHQSVHQFPNAQNIQQPLPPPPPPPLPHKLNIPQPPPPPPPPLPKKHSTYLPSAPPPPPPPPPNVPPPPPKPSEAVRRFMKKKGKGSASDVLADVWASNEELDFESSSTLQHKQQQPVSNAPNQYKRAKDNAVTTAGIEASGYDPFCPSADGYADYRCPEQISRSINKNTTRTDSSDSTFKSTEQLMRQQQSSQPLTASAKIEMWHYRDTNGIIQGPFPSNQMEAWRKAGFFPSNTPVKKIGSGGYGACSGSFVPIGSVTLSSIRKPANSCTNAIHHELGNESEEVEEKGNSIQDRIEALRSERMKDNKSKEGVRDANGFIDDQMLKNNVNNNNSVKIDVMDVERQTTVLPVLQHDDENEQDGSEVQYPTPINSETSSHPHIIRGTKEESISIHTSVDVDTGISPQPAFDDDLEGEEEDIPYPTDVAYPDGDDLAYPDGDDLAYPDTDFEYNNEITEVTPYGNQEHQTVVSLNQGHSITPQQPKKKRHKVDEAVVRFVPSHLQVRRATAPREVSTKKLKPNRSVSVKSAGATNEEFSCAEGQEKKLNVELVRIGIKTRGEKSDGASVSKASNTVGDDYDKFMQEIASLK